MAKVSKLFPIIISPVRVTKYFSNTIIYYSPHGPIYHSPIYYTQIRVTSLLPPLKSICIAYLKQLYMNYLRLQDIHLLDNTLQVLLNLTYQL